MDNAVFKTERSDSFCRPGQGYYTHWPIKQNFPVGCFFQTLTTRCLGPGYFAVPQPSVVLHVPMDFSFPQALIKAYCSDNFLVPKPQKQTTWLHQSTNNSVQPDIPAT